MALWINWDKQKIKTAILKKNKARYTATVCACHWTGAVIERVSGAFGQEQWAQNAQSCGENKKGTDRLTPNQPIDGCTDGQI